MKDSVFRIILRKSIVILAVSSLIVLAVGLFSVGGWTYAGFAAAFLGAAYLLNAWAKFTRARNRRIFPSFRRTSRSSPSGLRSAPYFHRKDKTDRPGIRSVGYHFNDSLEDEAEDDSEDDGRLPAPLRLKATSAAYAICGAVLLIASLFIY